MKSFPKYRIPVIFGWVMPPILAFFLVRELPFSIVLKIVTFPILTVVLFFIEILVALKIAGFWNKWQRKKDEENRREDS